MFSKISMKIWFIKKFIEYSQIQACYIFDKINDFILKNHEENFENLLHDNDEISFIDVIEMSLIEDKIYNSQNLREI